MLIEVRVLVDQKLRVEVPDSVEDPHKYAFEQAALQVPSGTVLSTQVVEERG